ncbi:hypothetical protein GTA08_BOTSDO00435 [Neofusicoccum parvum]|nr:hypothetical protein GTA08_BOTSDO00435 [Neofusicoccum parvum]
MTAAAFPKRFSSIPANKPTSTSVTSDKRSTTYRPATTHNPFSFNNYSFKPAPQPTAHPQPFDPADLTRRLNRYLASLESAPPNAAGAPSSSSKHAASSPAGARPPNAASQQQGTNDRLRPSQRSQPASAQSLASPASPNVVAKKKSSTALREPATRSATDPLPYSRSRPDDWQALEALRQEARRAKRRSQALQAKGVNAPVPAWELARRLTALAEPNADPAASLKPRKSLPDLRNSSSKGTAAAGQSVLRAKSSAGNELRVAALEHEREKAKGRRGGRRANAHAEAEMWRVFVATQTAAESNSQAMAQAHQPRPLRKSNSARARRPLSTTDLEWAAGGKVLQKSKSSGCVDSSSGTDEKSDVSSVVVGRRPDWSQRDEEDEKPLHLHLHVPGFGRRSSTMVTDSESGDERGTMSDVEGKRASRYRKTTQHKNDNNRKSICAGDAARSVADKKRPSPSTLHIPSNPTTLTSSNRSPTSPPSITLSPVDPLLLPADFFNSSPSSSFDAKSPGPLDRRPHQKPSLAPVAEVQPLPAPDRFSKRPKSFAARAAATVAATTKVRGQEPVAVPWPGPASAKSTSKSASTRGKAPPPPLPIGTREQLREKQSNLKLFPEGPRMVNRRSVTFAEMEVVKREEGRPMTAPLTAVPAMGEKRGVGGGAGKGEREKGGLQVRKEKGGEVVGVREAREVEGMRSPTRLVFWRRESGGAAGGGASRVDEVLAAAAAGDEVVRSPSRLAFWKKGSKA